MAQVPNIIAPCNGVDNVPSVRPGTFSIPVFSRDDLEWKYVRTAYTSLSRHIAIAARGGYIFLAGGTPWENARNFHVFDPAARSWRTMSMTQRRSGACIVLMGDNAFVFGGDEIGKAPTTEVFSISRNEWVTGLMKIYGSLPPTGVEAIAGIFMRAVEADGAIYVLHGRELYKLTRMASRSFEWSHAMTLPALWTNSRMTSGGSTRGHMIYLFKPGVGITAYDPRTLDVALTDSRMGVPPFPLDHACIAHPGGMRLFFGSPDLMDRPESAAFYSIGLGTWIPLSRGTRSRWERENSEWMARVRNRENQDMVAGLAVDRMPEPVAPTWLSMFYGSKRPRAGKSAAGAAKRKRRTVRRKK